MKKNLCFLLVVVMMLGISLQPVVMAAPSQWAEEEIGKAIEAEIVTDSVTKDYQADITREQFCELVVKGYERISGEEATYGSMSFSDTQNTEIRKAANLGIVAGYGDGRFGPNDLITREQIAAMLVRMIDKAVSYANINVYNNNKFNDGDYISQWAISSVNFAYDKGIMQGVGDNCIDPQANTTCEQAILLVYRTVKKYVASANDKKVFYLGTEHTKIDDEDDAKKLIKRKSQEIGIGNVEEELEYINSEEAMGDTFYYFRQMYEGYSVYGRSVTVGVDSSGYAVVLSDNYMPMEVDLSVEVEKSEIPELVEDYYDGEATSYLIHGLTIYSLEDLHSELSWNVSVTMGQESELLFISANDGEIVDSESMIYYDTVTGHGKDIDGNDCEFNTYTEDGQMYYMEDFERGIVVYDALDMNLKTNHIMVDEQGRLYRKDYERNIWLDENDNRIDYEKNSNDGTFTIKRPNGRLISDEARPAWYLYSGKDRNSFPENLQRDHFSDNVFSSISEIKNRETEWDDPESVTMMDRIAKLNDFYWEIFKRNGYDNKHGSVTAVICDWMNGQKNAYSKQDWNGVTLLSFSTSMPLSSDVIGHEYRHSVTASIKDGLAYKGESGALNEAYSDIFGELFEDWMDNGELDNSCDWINGDNGRNLSSPWESENPDWYQGENWDDTSDEKNDHGGVHKNSTVISHAAYLMSQGWEEDDAFAPVEPLTNSQLAKLFHLTSHLLPRDCTFTEFSDHLYTVAYIMYINGEINESQLCCVWLALCGVDLPPNSQGSISGRVTDEEGNAITDIERSVLVDNQLIEWSNGFVDGTFLSTLPVGTYTLLIEAEGYCSEEREVKLGFKEHVVLDDIVLEKETKNDWKSEYCNILNNTNYSEYTLYDIDKDNVPELILNDYQGTFDFQIYGMKDNKLIDYGEYYTSYGMYEYSKNGILITTGGTGVIVYIILQLQGEGLTRKEPALLEASVIPGVFAGRIFEEYLFEGQSISASEFYKNEKSVCENPISNFYEKSDFTLIDQWAAYGFSRG